jgi:hypothetical protein
MHNDDYAYAYDMQVLIASLTLRVLHRWLYLTSWLARPHRIPPEVLGVWYMLDIA